MKPAPLARRTIRRAQTAGSGVLIVNLGTPDGTDYWSIRRYLQEFLSDRRVIETPRALTPTPILQVILLRRPRAKGRDYDAILEQGETTRGR